MDPNFSNLSSFLLYNVTYKMAIKLIWSFKSSFTSKTCYYQPARKDVLWRHRKRQQNHHSQILCKNQGQRFLISTNDRQSTTGLTYLGKYFVFLDLHQYTMTIFSRNKKTYSILFSSLCYYQSPTLHGLINQLISTKQII